MEHPGRVVDAHVHHWDPARTDWYPFLAAADTSLAAVGMPDADRMRRPYDQPTFLAEASRWNVEAYVHVTAAPEHFVAETAEIARLAKETGQPRAIVGGVDGRDGAAGILAQLDAQAGAPGLRGVRASAGLDLDTDAGQALLGALQDRGLVYDLVVHPEGTEAAAAALAAFPDLTVVVEHTGWPLAQDPGACRGVAQRHDPPRRARPAGALQAVGPGDDPASHRRRIVSALGGAQPGGVRPGPLLLRV